MTDLEFLEIKKEVAKLELQSFDESYSYGDFVADLAVEINHLITADFPKFIALLYRVDISEKKLQAILQQSKDTTSARLVAEMIIERQLQKIQARSSCSQDSNIPENEKW